MGNNRELEEALIDVSRWIQWQRRTSWMLFFLSIPLMLGGGWMGWTLLSQWNDLRDELTQEVEKKPAWYEVSGAVHRNDFETALTFADALLKEHPFDFDGHYRRGEILLKKGDPAAALESFKRAAEIFPIPKHRQAVEALEGKEE